MESEELTFEVKNAHVTLEGCEVCHFVVQLLMPGIEQLNDKDWHTSHPSKVTCAFFSSNVNSSLSKVVSCL